jgi:hypothetical protein
MLRSTIGLMIGERTTFIGSEVPSKMKHPIRMVTLRKNRICQTGIVTTSSLMAES